MKKLLLMVVIAMLLGSCSDGKKTASKEKDVAEKKQDHTLIESEVDDIGIWDHKYYVDEFGDSSKNDFIATIVRGSFSNSATTNSRLTAMLLIDKSDIRIQLYEYAGNHPIKSEGFLNFKMKDSDGEIHNFRTYNDESGSNTVEKGQDEDVLKKALEKGGKISFVGKSTNYSTSEYKFTIEDSKHFSKAYSMLGNE